MTTAYMRHPESGRLLELSHPNPEQRQQLVLAHVARGWREIDRAAYDEAFNSLLAEHGTARLAAVDYTITPNDPLPEALIPCEPASSPQSLRLY